MVTSQYVYSRVNQLKTPHSYMYTAYEGPAFFAWYREDRLARGGALLERGLAVRDQCSAPEGRRLKTVLTRYRSALSPSVAARVESCLGAGEDTAPEDGERTTASLTACLEALSAASEESRASLRAQLSREVTRFEVTKKLVPPDDLGGYAAFSLALMLFHERWGSLKFLNAALKANDLLCSQEVLALTPFAALATAMSLDLEQRAVERLLTDKGIVHGA